MKVKYTAIFDVEKTDSNNKQYKITKNEFKEIQNCLDCNVPLAVNEAIVAWNDDKDRYSSVDDVCSTLEVLKD